MKLLAQYERTRKLVDQAGIKTEQHRPRMNDEYKNVYIDDVNDEGPDLNVNPRLRDERNINVTININQKNTTIINNGKQSITERVFKEERNYQTEQTE